MVCTIASQQKRVLIWNPLETRVFCVWGLHVLLVASWVLSGSSGFLPKFDSLRLRERRLYADLRCECEREMVIYFCTLPRDKLAICVGFVLQLGQAPAPTSTQHTWMDGKMVEWTFLRLKKEKKLPIQSRICPSAQLLQELTVIWIKF